jgi:serine protease DegQ
MRASCNSAILITTSAKGFFDMAQSILETISNEFAAAAEKAGGSVVAVHARRWIPTSGIEWKKGVIVTANHGVRRDDEIKVFLEKDRVVAGELAGRDPSTDLAVLRINEGTPRKPQFGDSSALKLGHLVLALGRTRRGELVASSGIVGGISGEWRTWGGGRLDQYIRLDLALYPGFSGGPLLNAKGEIVGLNTRGLSRGRSVAIPVATVDRVVNELLEKGHITRPYLGIAMQPVALPENLKAKLPPESRMGMLVAHVESAGPAEKAGILLGDLVFETGGKAVTHMDSVQDAIAAAKVGETISARLVRGGEIKAFSITLGERPR